MKMKIQLHSLSFLGLASVHVGAHTRLECPPPRSGETGVKTGPCDAPDDPSLPAYPLAPGAFNTITWLESVPHPGAPARLALSLDGDDSAESFESCLLLDHIPHDEYSAPDFQDELSWHRSSITIWVPDIKCERCHLQLMTVMSDEVHGVPVGTSCAYGGALDAGTVGDETLPACPIVYHSCSPVSIDGAAPRNEMTCDTAEFEEKLDWIRRPEDSDASRYDHSTYFYKGDPGLYDLSSSRLTRAGPPIEGCASTRFCDPDTYVTEMLPEDAKYASLVGTCAATVDTEVEAFALGVLPSTTKDPSSVPVPPSACSGCAAMAPCFAEACALRDQGTGAWSGPAAPCGFGDPTCEDCFPDSPCFGYGSGGGGEASAGSGAVDGGDENGAAEVDAKDESVETGAGEGGAADTNGEVAESPSGGAGAAPDGDGTKDASVENDAGEGGAADTGSVESDAEEGGAADAVDLASGGSSFNRSYAVMLLSAALGAVARTL